MADIESITESAPIDIYVAAPQGPAGDTSMFGTAAQKDTGTTNGTVPLIGAGDKLPASILPSIAITESLSVANTAARLALTAAQAAGKAVVEADTGDTYMLVVNGVPSVSGDWLKIGDRDVTWSEVSGKPSFGTASAANTGDAEGNVPTIQAGGLLKPTIIPDPDLGEIIHAATSLITPVDADEMGVANSQVAGYPLSRITWANIKAAIKSYLDSFYAAALGADDNYVTDAEKTKLANLSGTNTGDETAARIATITHGSTAKTTLVDADEIGLADSEASWAGKKSTLTSLWTWITTKLGALTSLTAGGAWAFSSTTRPTSSGTGTPSSNSLVLRSDCDLRYFDKSTVYITKGLTAANNATFYGPGAIETVANICVPFLPSKIIARAYIMFTSAPLAYDVTNFDFVIYHLATGTANMSTGTPLTVPATSVQKAAGLEQYLITAEIDSATIATAYSTLFSTYGILDFWEADLKNKTGGSLTTVGSNAGIITLEIYR